MQLPLASATGSRKRKPTITPRMVFKMSTISPLAGACPDKKAVNILRSALLMSLETDLLLSLVRVDAGHLPLQLLKKNFWCRCVRQGTAQCATQNSHAVRSEEFDFRITHSRRQQFCQQFGDQSGHLLSLTHGSIHVTTCRCWNVYSRAAVVLPVSQTACQQRRTFPWGISK